MLLHANLTEEQGEREGTINYSKGDNQHYKINNHLMKKYSLITDNSNTKSSIFSQLI